ncbi:MAG TPA: hypothetical protein VK947_01955 [Planococcus sp. (in: firmicutes)]|nr:hypothetical protein [Planococcus sp. (in: firmicutes)]
MLRLIDYLAGLIYDVLSVPLFVFSYLITGTILVGIPLYLLAFFFEWISSLFFI